MRAATSPLLALTRALNGGSRVVERTGLPLLRLDGEPLVAEARRRTRLEDFGDPDFQEPLGRLLAAYESEAHLSLLGRFAARKDTLRLLTSRLRLVEDRRRHPEIGAEEIRRPLFVTGLPRTGTTLLHGLLAQDPANRAPLHWETVYPSPPPERARHTTDRRIAAAERQLRWFRRLAPELPKIHPLGAELPEECLVITSHSFLSFQFQTTHHVPTYQSWLEEQDLRPSYEMHRRFLQHLQWRCPGERWVLKAPAHLFGLEALFHTYPDAGIILTHRHPLEVAASLASLTTVLRRTFSDATDPVAVGAEMTRRWARGIECAMRARDRGRVPAERFVDVRYPDLVGDPLGTVRRIYAHFDLPFTGEVEARMREFLAANPKDKLGRHQYSLAQFGLDPDEETERYRAYGERFGV
jgi:hypothetical protein